LKKNFHSKQYEKKIPVTFEKKISINQKFSTINLQVLIIQHYLFIKNQISNIHQQSNQQYSSIIKSTKIIRNQHIHQ